MLPNTMACTFTAVPQASGIPSIRRYETAFLPFQLLNTAPMPPQSCRVSDVYQDNCIVHWTPPADDGGTAIKKYVVECLDTTTGNGNWNPVATTDDGGAKKIKVHNLTPMHRYRFRVRAVNKIGESEPCEMKGDDILAKDPWGKKQGFVLHIGMGGGSHLSRSKRLTD